MDWLSRCVLVFLTYFEWIYLSLREVLHNGRKSEIVPASEEPLLYLSASVLAEKIRKNEITSESVVRAYVKRINEVNPIINAVVEDRFDDAIKDAKYVDDYLRSSEKENLKTTKPLLGVPVTIKECLAVKGLSYTACSKVRAGVKAEEDSDVVKFLKQSGAIPLLVSNTPEYCTSLDSANKIIGRTRNPYNTAYVGGGSSGGEGALIGAGASLIGIGSDILGSIRIPCAFNGIFGFKPTSGIVSLRGHFPMSSAKKFSDYLVLGPLTRYAEDLPLVLKVIASENASKLKLDENVDLKHVKIFFMEDAGSTFGLLGVEKELKIAIKEAVMYLSRQSHCVVTDTKFPGLKNSLEIITATVLALENAPNPLQDSKEKHNLFVEFVKVLFGKSIFTVHALIYVLMNMTTKLVPANNAQNVEEFKRLKEVLMDELKDNGVLIYPSFPTGPLKPGLHFTAVAGISYPGIFNALEFPVACVPVGLNKDQMPIGIQIIAAPYQDRLCLAIAQELEKCFLGWQAPASQKI